MFPYSQPSPGPRPKANSPPPVPAFVPKYSAEIVANARIELEKLKMRGIHSDSDYWLFKVLREIIYGETDETWTTY